MAWQRTYSGSAIDESMDIETTLEGGDIRQVKHPQITINAYPWILKLDKDGNGQWQKTDGAAAPILIRRLLMEVTPRRSDFLFRGRQGGLLGLEA